MKEEDLNYINITEDGGIKKLILEKGTGIKASLNKEVFIKYIAKYNEKIYDDSSNTIFRFTTGKNDVIKGLELSVLSMICGERCCDICRNRINKNNGRTKRYKRYGLSRKNVTC